MKKRFIAKTDVFKHARLLRGIYFLADVERSVRDAFSQNDYDILVDRNRIVATIKASGAPVFEAGNKLDGRTHTGKAVKPPNPQSILAAIESVRRKLQFSSALVEIDDKMIRQITQAA